LRTGAEAGRVGRSGIRSATRPATARRAASAGAAKRTTAPGSGRLTGRATALGLILVALMLAYAYPVRLYLDQQAEIQRLEVAQATQRANIAHLQSESAKWNDPAYIKAQARARFQMVKPGEKAYLVLPAPVALSSGAPSAAKPKPTWYGRLWSALRAADTP
jgi:cell division protein FtsB